MVLPHDMTNKQKPTRLIYPEDYWRQWPDDAAQHARLNFMKAFGKYLGHKTSKVCLADIWQRANPTHDGQSLKEYLEHVSRPINFDSTSQLPTSKLVLSNAIALAVERDD